MLAFNEVLAEGLVDILSFPESLKNKLNPIVDTEHIEEYQPGYGYRADIVNRRNGQFEFSSREGTLAGARYVRINGRKDRAGKLIERSVSGIIDFSDGDPSEILSRLEAVALIEGFLKPKVG